MSEKLKEAAAMAVAQCLGVKTGETVLVVTDEQVLEVGDALWRSSREAGADAVLVMVDARDTHGSEPPGPVAEAMKAADVVFAPTSWSISHTRARKEACDTGTRVATLPTVTADIMARAIATDYEALEKITTRLADVLTDGSSVRLTTPAGTDVTFSIEGRTGLADTGILTDRGSFGNLPAGEAFTAPVEGTAQGVVVVDGSMAGIGIIDQPIKLVMNKGVVESIEGGSAADKLTELLDGAGPKARVLAELGIGTNKSATITGIILEDEKVWGTAHVAFGSNSTFGGTNEVSIHLDGILNKPTLWIDGLMVIRDGEPHL